MVARLQDSKVEVASLATATLSGIIKALPPHELNNLRSSLVAQVPRLFGAPAGSKARRGGGASRALPVVAAAAAAGDAAAAVATQQQQGTGFLAEAQAVVQGLKAFVLSSPYDVPQWMPEVLMALVTAANNRHPLVSVMGCVCVLSLLLFLRVHTTHLTTCCARPLRTTTGAARREQGAERVQAHARGGRDRGAEGAARRGAVGGAQPGHQQRDLLCVMRGARGRGVGVGVM